MYSIYIYIYIYILLHIHTVKWLLQSSKLCNHHFSYLPSSPSSTPAPNRLVCAKSLQFPKTGKTESSSLSSTWKGWGARCLIPILFSSIRTWELEFTAPLALHKAVDRSCANACTRVQTAGSFALLFCSLSSLANKRTWGPFGSQIQVG